MLKVFVNDTSYDFAGGNIAELLASVDLKVEPGMAVVRNGQVVSKKDLPNVALKDGDRIILIAAAQGG